MIIYKIAYCVTFVIGTQYDGIQYDEWWIVTGHQREVFYNKDTGPLRYWSPWTIYQLVDA